MSQNDIRFVASSDTLGGSTLGLENRFYCTKSHIVVYNKFCCKHRVLYYNSGI